MVLKSGDHHLVLKPVVNNGINYQPQLVRRISEPSTVLIWGPKTDSRFSMEVPPQAINFFGWKHPLKTSCLVIMVDLDCAKCLKESSSRIPSWKVEIKMHIRYYKIKYGEHIVQTYCTRIILTWDLAAFILSYGDVCMQIYIFVSIYLRDSPNP